MPTVNRADTAVNLELSGAWNGGAGPAPTSADVATWGSPNIITNPSRGLGTNVSWGGIALLSTQTTNISLGVNARAITLGADGVNLSAAGANLTFGTNTITLGANQPWSVASGRTLTVSTIVSGAFSLTKSGTGTLALSTGANTFGGSGQTFTASAGLTTVAANASLGSALNKVVVSSGAAMQITATAPQQTVWEASGSGTATSYGAINTTGAFGATRTITMKAPGTVLGIRAGVTFTGIVALDTGINTITLNGENTGTVDTSAFGMTTTSNYVGTVTLSSLDLDNTTFRAVKYTIGSAAGATDANTSGGGGLGNNANDVIVSTTGGLYSTSASGTFNRNYTFNARGARQVYNQFRSAVSVATTTFNGTLTLSGGTSDYVQFAGFNFTTNIIKLNGTITGGANLDIGKNGSNGNVEAVFELGSALNSSGWSSTAALSVNHIRYGTGLANDNAITFQQGQPSIIDAVASGVTARHSSYTNLSATNFTFTGTNDLTMTGPIAGSANWTGALGTVTVTLNTLTLGFNVVSATPLTKAGAGTLVLSGANTGITTTAWSAGNLTLNSAGALGTTGTDNLTVTSTGVLDNTSGGAITLSKASATNALNANFTWKGTSSLTFGAGNITTSIDRIIAFAGTGENGTLKFSGAITTSALTTSWDFGGSTAGAKQRVTLVGANASLSETTAANQHAVTAGYFRIENNNGLGAVSATTTWWVGATNLGVQTTKAALELAGVTTPEIKNVNLYNIGPNDDGALIGASGTSVFSGNISVPNVAGTRIGVKNGATLTLLGSGIYPNLNPANASTPLSFTAESNGTLNVNRVLGGGGTSNAGTVTVANSLGTVVFSRANLHTGAMTCSSGTTKLTNVNAAGAGAGNSVTVSAGATMEVTAKVVFPATLTLGSTGSAATFKVSV